ncbi:hypothetical protein Cni_G03433 [Canna indica]|uniref:Uncharacterized protein n=1 Tax=Canna indica TaxID=4628 RepID=A0AAQ3JR53_9LILI|nr:hypothetical protein Cni_G03433 [Canna indica]
MISDHVYNAPCTNLLSLSQYFEQIRKQRNLVQASKIKTRYAVLHYNILQLVINDQSYTLFSELLMTAFSFNKSAKLQFRMIFAGLYWLAGAPFSMATLANPSKLPGFTINISRGARSPLALFTL